MLEIIVAIIFAMLLVMNMAKIDFDNLAKVYRAENNHAAGGVLSSEIDLELPRGYIAKIYRVELRVIQNTIPVAGSTSQTMYLCLVADPDDATTDRIPEGQVQHDVVCDLEWGVQMDATDDIIIWGSDHYIYEVPKHIDIVSARNLRFNSSQSAADQDYDTVCEVFYTLEKVTDADFLQLLDIL